MKKIQIFYDIQNNGDGSASVLFFNSQKQSDKHMEIEMEEYEYFAEDCTGKLEVTIHEDGTYSIPPKPYATMDEEPYDDIYLVDKNKPAKLEVKENCEKT